MKSKAAVSPRLAASRLTNRAFFSDLVAASALAVASPVSEKSNPVNCDRGKASAIKLIAWPEPHPMSGDINALVEPVN